MVGLVAGKLVWHGNGLAGIEKFGGFSRTVISGLDFSLMPMGLD